MSETPDASADASAPAPTDERRGLRIALLALAALGLVAHALVFDFVNDDAFISFRYADNLVRHGELVYNVGERVEGYTNFLWTMLMAAVLGLGLDIVALSKWLGIAFGVGTLLVVARFSARYLGRRTPWDALAPTLLAAAPAYACWSTGGLETAQFTFFVTLAWTSWLLERQAVDAGRDVRWPLSGVWLGFSALARPEGLLIFGLIGLCRLGELALVDRKIKPHRSDWVWGFGFAAVFAPYQAWRWWYYGWPFPNTYYVKTGAKNFWGPGLRYFTSWVTAHGLWVVPALAVLRRGLPGRREGRLLALATLMVGGVSLHVIRVGGDFMALHRFLVPVMPVVAVLAALGVGALVERLLAAGHGFRRIAVGAALAATLYGLQVARVDREALRVGSEGGVDSIGWLAMFAEQTTAIGEYLAENAPPDASLATTAAGIIPYYSRLHTLDVLGLNDEWIAHNVPAHGNRPGHTKSAPLDYILQREIDYLVYHPTISAREPRKGAGEKRSWKQRGYVWEAVKVPGLEPPWWGYWRRQE